MLAELLPIAPTSNRIRIVLGVTGHRTLRNESRIIKKVHEVLARIKQEIFEKHKITAVFTILSLMAEGADRVVAREILKEKDSILEVVLPLPKEDYMNDFVTSESKTEFEEFIVQAAAIKELLPARSRNEAYEQAGQYVVDHCDVLLALWNGKPAAGQGGTAEIVAYARKKKRPLFWIHTEKVQLTFEPGKEESPS